MEDRRARRAAYPAGEGPPAGYRQGDLDADFHQLRLGLLALGAAAIRAGHQVKVLNLSGFAWSKVEEIVQAPTPTSSASRAGRPTGAASVSWHRSYKEIHPRAHVVVGGPTRRRSQEMLAHRAAIDTVSVGESDDTFLELASIARVAFRSPGSAAVARPTVASSSNWAPERARSRRARAGAAALRHPHPDDVARLPVGVHLLQRRDHVGKGFRANSIDYVLRSIESVLARLPVKMIRSDDTFTTNKRVVDSCRGIARARSASSGTATRASIS
ncbi:MAG: hypothetical protein U0235_30710 [Polyangiaceae bacterium]